MKKRETELFVDKEKIIKMFFEGRDIVNLTKLASHIERTEKYDARQKVEQAILEYYLNHQKQSKDSNG